MCIYIHLLKQSRKRTGQRLSFLLKQGTNVNVAHEDTALVTAIDMNPKTFDIEIVRMLINAKGIEINKYSTKPMGAFLGTGLAHCSCLCREY
jgi:hypothetical protein